MSNVIIFGDTGTNFRAIGCDVDGNMNVNVVSGGGGGSGGVVQGIKDGLAVDINATNTGLDNNSLNTYLTNSAIAITNSGTNNLNCNITNASIDSHIYGSNNGTTWHHILTSAQGRILNNSSTQDGDGTNINSVSVSGINGLSVNVNNEAVSSTRKSNRNGAISNLQNGGSIGAVSGVSIQLIVQDYGTNCIWNYEDSLTTSLEPVLLYGFAPSSGLYSQPIAKISPTPISGAVGRSGFTYIDLSPFTSVQIINKGGITFTDVYSSIMSG